MQYGDFTAMDNKWFIGCIGYYNNIQHQHGFIFISWFNALESLGKSWWIGFLKKIYTFQWVKIPNWSSSGDYWGRVICVCINNSTSIVSDNGLLPGWCKAIMWTNDMILLLGPLGTNFSEILIEIHTFSFKKMYLKILSVKWQPFFSASMC